MSVNCQIEDISRNVQATGIRKVSAIKHLGLTIDKSGSLPTQSNIEPIKAAMEKIADTLSTSTSTPTAQQSVLTQSAKLPIYRRTIERTKDNSTQTDTN